MISHNSSPSHRRQHLQEIRNFIFMNGNKPAETQQELSDTHTKPNGTPGFCGSTTNKSTWYPRAGAIRAIAKKGKFPGCAYWFIKRPGDSGFTYFEYEDPALRAYSKFIQQAPPGTDLEWLQKPPQYERFKSGTDFISGISKTGISKKRNNHHQPEGKSCGISKTIPTDTCADLSVSHVQSVDCLSRLRTDQVYRLELEEFVHRLLTKYDPYNYATEGGEYAPEFKLPQQ